jgi:hypothetical protein
MVFRRGGAAWLTEAGHAVVLPTPVTLAPPNFVETIVNRFQPHATLTVVGYGTGEAHNKPGDGGNKGGVVNDPSKLGVRWQTSLIPVSRSLHGPGRPGVVGERAKAAGLGGERVPGRAGGVDDRLVAAGEDAVAQSHRWRR